VGPGLAQGPDAAPYHPQLGAGQRAKRGTARQARDSVRTGCGVQRLAEPVRPIGSGQLPMRAFIRLGQLPIEARERVDRGMATVLNWDLVDMTFLLTEF